MHKPSRYRQRSSLAQIPLALKGLILIFLLCVAVRILSALGADTSTKDYMAGLASNKNVVEAILDFELGSAGKADTGVSLASLILDPFYYKEGTQDAAAGADALPSSSPSPSSEATAASASPSGASDSGLFYHDPGTTPKASSPPNVISKPAQGTSADSIAVYNKTGYTIDTAALLKEPLKLSLVAKKPAVLIIHTHSSEAYLPDGNDKYVASDPFRTQDQSKSIIRVGDELASAFEKAGISVIHDKGVYDYPSYEGAYNRSYDAIQAYLKKYPSIKIVIDMHRDAIGTDDTVYKTIAQIGNTTCSQVLMVMGTNFSGLQHPNWKENFKLALHIQQEMNKLYPSLAKPIELSQYRYNQQAAPGSMIVEVGCTGNTLQESLAAVRYFADAASKVILGLYK